MGCVWYMLNEEKLKAWHRVKHGTIINFWMGFIWNGLKTWNSSENRNSNCDKLPTIFYLERVKWYMRHDTVLDHWILVNDRECLTKWDKGTLQACNSTASKNDGNLQGVFYLGVKHRRRLKICRKTEKKMDGDSYHINFFWSGLKNTWSISNLNTGWGYNIACV